MPAARGRALTQRGCEAHAALAKRGVGPQDNRDSAAHRPSPVSATRISIPSASLTLLPGDGVSQGRLRLALTGRDDRDRLLPIKQPPVGSASGPR